MAPVKGVVASIPEMDEVTPEKELLITEFLNLFKITYPDKLPPSWADADDVDQRIMAYKFLTARKWKMKDAMHMATTTVDWRAHHGVDGMGLFPTAFRAYGYETDHVVEVLGCQRRVEGDYAGKACRLIEASYQSGFHYWDRQGHPVLIMFFGRCDVRTLFRKFQQLANIGEKPTHAAVKYHTYENEVAGALVRYKDKVNRALPDGHPDKVNRRILGVTCVLDCAGLGYGHLWNPILDILRSEFAVDAAHYPEGLHRVLVVNCPTMIKFAYTIVKGALDPRVQQKIVFCSAGDETNDTMRLVMDTKILPTFLGGEWTCPDGGTWGSQPLVDSTGVADAASDVVTEDISISAGTVHEKEYAMAAGEEVSWEFASTTGYDIRFMVFFFAGANIETNKEAREGQEPDGATVVVPLQKLKDGADYYEAKASGVLRLVWDNTSSWFKGKKLQMRVIKSAPVDASEAD